MKLLYRFQSYQVQSKNIETLDTEITPHFQNLLNRSRYGVLAPNSRRNNFESCPVAACGKPHSTSTGNLLGAWG